jgi:Spermidine/putrescine-binding periplasmic protein
MEKVVLAAVLLLCGVLSPLRAGEAQKPILHVYSWNDYFSEDVVAAFEDKYDCHVSFDYFNSNEEMYADLESSGADLDIDIVTPSAYMAWKMHESGMLAPIDHDLLPNAVNLDRSFLVLAGDENMKFSVPYTRTITGIGYNRALIEDVESSWTIFFNTDLRGRMTLLSDMRETIGAALKYLGYSLNTTNPREIEEAGVVLMEWKSNISRFEVDESNLGLGSNELIAAHAYNGDIAILMEINRDIGFFVPQEGTAVNCDSFVILAGSQKKDLAHAFIDHFLDIDYAARNMEAIHYYMPVPEAVAKLPANVLDNPTFSASDATLALCEPILDVGVALELYERLWEEVAPAEITLNEE